MDSIMDLDAEMRRRFAMERALTDAMRETGSPTSDYEHGLALVRACSSRGRNVMASTTASVPNRPAHKGYLALQMQLLQEAEARRRLDEAQQSCEDRCVQTRRDHFDRAFILANQYRNVFALVVTRTYAAIRKYAYLPRTTNHTG